MKYYLITTAFTLLTAAGMAQDDETLFSDIKRVGAFGGPIIEYGFFEDDVETATGGGGAFVLDDFFLGGYGHGTLTLGQDFPEFNRREQVKFKHGGFWIGYVPIQKKVVHPYTSLKLGWGKARFEESYLDDDERIRNDRDNIFVLTPEAGIELNVFSFFRISATASYRLVTGIDKLENFSDGDLSGFGAILTLRFGGFGGGWDWD